MNYANEFLEISEKSRNLTYIKPVYEKLRRPNADLNNENLDLIYFFNEHIADAGLTSNLSPIKDYAKSLYSEIKDFKKNLSSELKEELSSEITGLEKLCKDFF